jgi:mycofactocin system glycosyltransferase
VSVDAGRALPVDTGLGLPAGFTIEFDPSTRRIDDGAVLVGGAPLRLLRLSPAGRRFVDRLAAGHPVPSGSSGQALARRLVDSGMAHPRPPVGWATTDDVTVVIPVRDEYDALAAMLGSIGTVAAVLVVDDGRLAAASGAAAGCGVPAVSAGLTGGVAAAGPAAGIAAAAGAALLRNVGRHGPAAARNTGWREARTRLVAFLDADTEPQSDWLVRLLPHFDDPLVAAVAPRVTATPGSAGAGSVVQRWMATYEAVRSPLDLGAAESIVRPRSRVPYVPTAALIVRRDVLEDLAGFDEELRFGEDVDFVWRVAADGRTVRYEPAATVAHPCRRTAIGWARQRFNYGSSAAPLARRHGRAVAPLAVSAWSAGAWALGAMGYPLAGVSVAVVTTASLGRRLRGLGHPWREAIRLAGVGHLRAGGQVAGALRRVWWPPAVVLALRSRRGRRALVLAAAVPLVFEWVRRRPPMGLARWLAFRLADDLAYGAGVWAGCARERSFRALLPDLSNWPGRGPAVEPATRGERPRQPPEAASTGL